MQLSQTIVLVNEMQTLAFGKNLAQACGQDNPFIYLSGELGTGKTTLVRGFLQALGYSERVKSPSYTLVESYEVADKTIYHFDFYRLIHWLELTELGLETYFTPANLCLVEWPDSFIKYLPTPDIQFNFLYFQTSRQVSLQACTPLGEKLLSHIALLIQ